MVLIKLLQYNVPNLMYVFQKLSEGNTLETPIGTGTHYRVPSPAKSWLRACYKTAL